MSGKILFSAGLNEKDESAIDLTECASGHNFDLGFQDNSMIPRPPQDLKGAVRFFEDNYTDTDTTVLGSHTSDSEATYAVVTAGTAQILNNRLHSNGAAHEHTVSQAATGTTYSIYSKMTWMGPGADSPCIVGYYGGDGAGSGVGFYFDYSANQIKLIETDGVSVTGNSQPYLSTNFVVGTDYEFRLDLTEASAYLYIDGIQVASRPTFTFYAGTVPGVIAIGADFFLLATSMQPPTTTTGFHVDQIWAVDRDNSDIRGILQLITRADVETTLVVAGPNVYLWDGALYINKKAITDSGLLRESYWGLDEYLVVTDVSLNNPVYNWDGTTFGRHQTGIALGSPQATTLANSTTTATATDVAHGRLAGDLVIMAGANEAPYNGEFEILTVPTADTWTYLMDSDPGGVGTGTITADRSTDVYAKYSIVHNGRMWLFNVKTDDGTTVSTTPHLMVASAYENPKSFDTANRAESGSFATGNEAFYITMPNLRDINGVVLFHNTLIISTSAGRMYQLVGRDANDYALMPFYEGSSAIGTEAIAGIGNDVVFMRSGGVIERMSATAKFGDAATDAISRWIAKTTKNLTDAKIVYDKTKQVVYFFVTGKVLVLYKELLESSQLSPWSVFKTNMANSFNTNAVRYLRVPGGTDYTVYWGDSLGNIYDISGIGTSGDGGENAISTSRETGLLDSGNARIKGKLTYTRDGEVTVGATFSWADEFTTFTNLISLKGGDGSGRVYYGGTAYYGGEYYYNQGDDLAGLTSRVGFSPVGKGSAFTIELNVESASRFHIDSMELK